LNQLFLPIRGAWPVDPFEFSLVVSLAHDVFQAHDARCVLDEITGDTLSALDGPFLEVLDGLSEMYSDEPPEKFISVCWRLFALLKMLGSGALNGWASPGTAQIVVGALPEHILLAAAACPLESTRGFDPARFLEMLAQAEPAP
jgi:hypothetical protein